MLTFSAINDYKGIRKGQVWELEKCVDNESPMLTPIWERTKYVMVRRIDNIYQTIFLVRSELEENFEWVKQ